MGLWQGLKISSKVPKFITVNVKCDRCEGQHRVRTGNWSVGFDVGAYVNLRGGHGLNVYNILGSHRTRAEQEAGPSRFMAFPAKILPIYKMWKIRIV